MNLKKLFALCCSGLLAMSFVACGDKNKCAHTDKNDDGKCDVCQADYTDGADLPTSVDCTFTLKTDKGVVGANSAFSLVNGENEYSLVANENGVISENIAFGEYNIEYNFDTLPQYCTPDTFKVKITEETTAITLLFIDNTLDGSAEKPFFVADDVTELSLVAGAEVYYVYRGAEQKTLVINNENVSVIYNGNTYSPVSGVIEVELQTQIGAMSKFCIKNTSTIDVETQFSLLSPLGSMSNPIVMTQSTATANVPKNDGIYYQWTATKNGVLVVSSQNAKNNIAMTNMNTNAVSSSTLGSACTYIIVSENDDIHIAVSSNNPNEAVSIEFTVAEYAGTTADPVIIPQSKSDIELSLNANSELVFVATVGKTIVIEDEPDVTVTYNGAQYPGAQNSISVTLTDIAVFSVSNGLDTPNDITIELK